MASRKPYKFWQDKANMVREARKVMRQENYDTLPSADALQELGHGSLAAAITKYGGYYTLRQELGEGNLKKPSGYWKKLDHALKEARAVIEDHDFDTLPSQNKLTKMGCAALSIAIIHYHGGFHNFRKLLGESSKRVKRNSWKDLEFTLTEVKKIMNKHHLDEPPSANWLREHEYSGIGRAITEYHGGFRKMRKRLGNKQKLAIRNRETVTKEVKVLMKKHKFSTLPSSVVLTSLGLIFWFITHFFPYRVYSSVGPIYSVQ